MCTGYELTIGSCIDRWTRILFALGVTTVARFKFQISMWYLPVRELPACVSATSPRIKLLTLISTDTIILIHTSVHLQHPITPEMDKFLLQRKACRLPIWNYWVNLSVLCINLLSLQYRKVNLGGWKLGCWVDPFIIIFQINTYLNSISSIPHPWWFYSAAQLSWATFPRRKSEIILQVYSTTHHSFVTVDCILLKITSCHCLYSQFL